MCLVVAQFPTVQGSQSQHNNLQLGKTVKIPNLVQLPKQLIFKTGRNDCMIGKLNTSFPMLITEHSCLLRNALMQKTEVHMEDTYVLLFVSAQEMTGRRLNKTAPSSLYFIMIMKIDT